ncbi:hypothetical protein GPECTOR_7g1252 [Gonium pectorale]|uniref:Uncharacterized protein n=1 Tax=Gonium pectorale TaxID=33097 RepID=A0A150GU02_GONPE|nr:hypothetical protein GPECTOR_7g1252 [Gonium pectorale]|eukprot:KXZ53356.1 hypothetical protein GPECTOR_7g1252 [Gonium pectorale]
MFQVVDASLTWWRTVQFEMEIGSPPPVPGLPTLLEQARLAAGTAEALCRLWRGQGLRGAFGPSGQATWQAGVAEIMRCTFLDAPLESLSAVAADECRPYWLEAGCWGVALALEALAAQLEGRLVLCVAAGAHPGDQRLTHGSPVRTLQNSLSGLEVLLKHPAVGLHSLSDASRAELSGRLQRAGLEDSLDRALRLAFTALDHEAAAAAAPTGSGDLTAASARACTLIPYYVGRVLRTGLLPVLPPSAGGGAATTAAEGHQRGRQTFAGAAGVLVTAVKRACALTTLLAKLGASAAATHDPAPELVNAGVQVLYCVLWGARTLRLQLREQAAGQMAAASSAPPEPAGGRDEGLAAGQEPGRGLLALALRSACGLTAQLAATIAARICRPIGAAGGGTDASSNLGALDLGFAAGCVAICLDQLAATGRSNAIGGLLTTQELLACQPHRLLAAATVLLCAAPPPTPGQPLRLNAEVQGNKHALAQGLAAALVTLAARPELSNWVQAWLEAPQPLAAHSASVGTGRPVAMGPAGLAAEDIGVQIRGPPRR